MFALGKALVFPPVELSDPDGLLAIGGDLSRERLLLAYRSGIFPWYEAGDILWWCPDPRFIIVPEEINISKSMRTLLRRNAFDFTVNKAFDAVIRNCKTVPRRGQQGTWITHDVYKAFSDLHQAGFAHSAEAWRNGELVGGLYGVRLGNVFFGESMFSKVSNGSKYAFIRYVEQLQKEGVRLIDCQVYTEHLESLGAKMIPRKNFISLLSQLA